MTTHATPSAVAILEFLIDPSNDGKGTRMADFSTTATQAENASDEESHDSDFDSQQRSVLIPPDLISASTSSGDDGSVSSLSSGECPSVRRSIFGAHLQKEPKKVTTERRIRPFPKTMVARSCPFSCESDDEELVSEDERSGNTYENVLKKQEGIKIASPSGRKSIFGACLSPQRSQSFHEDGRPCFVFNPSTRMRQACSDSALVMKQAPSCLRSPKYSGDDPVRRIDRSTPVSFSDRVTVIKYEIPHEQWAPSGWSNYFH